MSNELSDFVRRALQRGHDKAEIEARLREAGWARDEISDALGLYADIRFPVAIPRPRPYLSAAEAFAYLVLFGTLYASCIALVQLLFEFVHFAFPDASHPQPVWRSATKTVRWSMATLSLAFPVFLFLARRIHRQVRARPENRRSRIRKWLTYLTLSVAAAILLIDVTTLVFFLLDGELTLRFFLKFLIVLMVTGGALLYLSWDIRQDDREPTAQDRSRPGLRALALSVSTGVALSLVGGFLLAGSPSTARAEALDDRRQRELDRIANGIDTYYQVRDELPEDLPSVLGLRQARVTTISDPKTNVPYEYRVLGEKEFELCAFFDGHEKKGETHRPVFHEDRFWNHTKGRNCFGLEVRSP